MDYLTLHITRSSKVMCTKVRKPVFGLADIAHIIVTSHFSLRRTLRREPFDAGNRIVTWHKTNWHPDDHKVKGVNGCAKSITRVRRMILELKLWTRLGFEELNWIWEWMIHELQSVTACAMKTRIKSSWLIITNWTEQVEREAIGRRHFPKHWMISHVFRGKVR
jgi:hypothetical protein